MTSSIKKHGNTVKISTNNNNNNEFLTRMKTSTMAVENGHELSWNIGFHLHNRSAQGCKTWDFIPRSLEFLKVLGRHLEFIFSKKTLG